ncbi:hypothetical protein EW146_g4615 [Bondarzewia mesenterica]|uniref:G-alpha-domain-containing protein n=1 Tax=Bondarzewia mesenterica TaxID=1095465 RepID=A0A4S4LU65_9AGAM|nr:hypothetical protein EW146_g4615 [Bondarzewia mesenterica]
MSPIEVDPLSVAWAPPADESAQEKEERLQREAAAQRVSDAIDESLRAERAALKKAKVVKILLLGQSESDLQMTYAPTAWADQRASWRAVIQLNLLRSINAILDVISYASSPITRSSSPLASQPPSIYSRLDQDTETGSSHDHSRSENPAPLTEKHALLRLRLGPLRSVETDLRMYLNASFSDTESAEADAEQWATPFDGPVIHDPEERDSTERRRLHEFFVRVRGTGSSVSEHSVDKKARGRDGKSVLDEATDVIAGCAEDMKTLWEDMTVRALLESTGKRLWQDSGFFLDSIDRIVARNYTPSDNDVVRARLRTIGVQEHRLVFEKDGRDDQEQRRSKEGSLWSKNLSDWIIYDVGGCRTNRNAWLPYFTDLTAIIFLAPLSCFDEVLSEDPKVNRLEDSFGLWTAVVTSPLLARVMMILFMNKCDLLDRKLRTGVKINSYFPSYGDRSNTSGTAIKFFASKFKDTLVRNSPEARRFYGYPTSVVDTAATALTLQSVYDGIIFENLKQADFV